ncbi:VOC family protein [Bacillus sp. 2205SS5-2]|uniref:VOC family protein n=1 Tax=Bacillus sp. 2205SS5-2 TaxID=3109031 RepID=UPI003003D28D
MGFHDGEATYVDQVKIKVTNLERSLTFYQDIVGFTILDKNDKSASLTVDGKKGVLFLEAPETVVPKQRGTTGLYHFAILLPTRSDLASFLYHINQKGIELGAADHLVSEALYFSDPDGNGIEVYADRTASNWQWTNGSVAMATNSLDVKDLLLQRVQQDWLGLPINSVMGHIHLHVSDLQKAKSFYTKALGFELVTEYGSQALFLSTNGYHHHIGLNTWNGVGALEPLPNSVGLQHFGLMFPTEEARQQAIERLKELSAPVTAIGEVIVTEDPSGNSIILGFQGGGSPGNS